MRWSPACQSCGGRFVSWTPKRKGWFMASTLPDHAAPTDLTQGAVVVRTKGIGLAAELASGQGAVMARGLLHRRGRHTAENTTMQGNKLLGLIILVLGILALTYG